MNLRDEFNRLSKLRQTQLRQTVAAILQIRTSEVPEELSSEWIAANSLDPTDIIEKIVVIRSNDDDTLPPLVG